MQRTLLAITGLILTAVGAWMSFVSGQVEFGSILFRSGLVIGALALALPQVTQFFSWFPPWLLACAAGGFFIILSRPRAAIFVLPALAALWFLGPRQRKPHPQPKRRAKRPTTSSRTG